MKIADLIQELNGYDSNWQVETYDGEAHGLSVWNTDGKYVGFIDVEEVK